MAEKELRLIHTDQFLSNLATAYRINDNVADFIASPFVVKKDASKYLAYSKDVFRLYDNRAVRREKAKEVEVNAEEKTYEAIKYKLGTFISDDDFDNTDDEVKLESKKIKSVKDAMILAREKRVYDIAGSASIVTQTVGLGGDWDDPTNGTPVSDILTGLATIHEATGGFKANRIVMPYSVAINAIKTAEWKDYFKYTGDGNLWDLLAGLRNLGLEGRIAGAFGVNTQKGAASDPGIETMWSDSVLLFYGEDGPTTDSRCFMKSPYVYKDRVRYYRSEEEEGWYYEVGEKIDELLVDASCAYLMTNAL